MSAIDELRRMLDERGVKHYDHYSNTSWFVGRVMHVASDQFNGMLVVDMLTPKQAIAATLGSHTERTCRNISGVPLKFKCSKCGDILSKPSIDEFNYCPNCGGRVVGV